MTIEKTIEDLVSSIKGKSMLCGWDVLVAYNETELNKLLDTAHKELDKDNAVTDVKQFQGSYEGKYFNSLHEISFQCGYFSDLTVI